jgi:hypothetical protein
MITKYFLGTKEELKVKLNLEKWQSKLLAPLKLG